MRWFSLLLIIGFICFSESDAFCQNVPDNPGATQMAKTLKDFCGKAEGLIRVAIFNFLLFYGLYLAISIGLGQADAEGIAKFVIGCMFAAAAQLLGAVMGIIFPIPK